MKKALIVMVGLLVIIGAGRALLKVPAIHDRVLERATKVIAQVLRGLR